MGAVNLSSAMRSTLFELKSISKQVDAAQQRLATGLKVSSALDNPNSFFTAASLRNRASDLKTLVSSMGTAQSTVTAASQGIDTMESLLNSARSIAYTALQSSDPTVRASAATQFDALRTQIDQAAEDASFNGVNLLRGDTLTVTFNETGSSQLTITGANLSSTNLGVAAAANDWVADVDIEAALEDITDAITSLRGTSEMFGSNSAVVSARQEFTQSMINTLETGADELVVADPNEEAAIMLALRSRQDMAAIGLSITQQAGTAALRLLGFSS